MKNLWQKLSKPFFVLAPMDDVTDVVFREIVCDTARPDVFFTEFTNVEALQSAGREVALRRLKFKPNQHPVVAQIWGKNPENFYKSAKDIVKLGFDGIDINMGCPEKNVVKNGTCSALINNPVLAAEIIAATKKGAGKLPVSVKTRIGFSKIQTEEWIGFLLKQDLAAITIHGRTRNEQSKVPAHWGEILKAVKLRDELGVKTLIVGNGDVTDYQEGIKKVKQTGVDGIMIGRGIFKDLWAFDKSSKFKMKSSKFMLQLLLKHARLFDKTWGNTKHFLILRRFFKIYVQDFPHAANLRNELMQTNNLKDVEQIVDDYLKRYNEQNERQQQNSPDQGRQILAI